MRNAVLAATALAVLTPFAAKAWDLPPGQTTPTQAYVSILEVYSGDGNFAVSFVNTAGAQVLICSATTGWGSVFGFVSPGTYQGQTQSFTTTVNGVKAMHATLLGAKFAGRLVNVYAVNVGGQCYIGAIDML